MFFTGGGGTRFEFDTHAAFIVMTLISTFDAGHQRRANNQTTPAKRVWGYSTDDVLIWSKSIFGQEHRSLIQVKPGMSIANSNEAWIKVLTDAWKDFVNPTLFDKATDRLIVIVDNLSTKQRKHLKELMNRAKAKSTQEDFFNNHYTDY